MKKFLSFFCTIAMLFVFAGCAQISSSEIQSPNSTEPSPTQTTNPSEPATPSEPTTPPATEPTVIELTPENITDYLIFSLKTEDIKVVDQGYLSYEKGTGTLVVKSSPKKDVTFNDVTITVSFVTSSSAWGTMEGREIEIPFNGTSENNFSLYSRIEDYVAKSPSYKIEVTAVTGSVTLK